MLDFRQIDFERADRAPEWAGRFEIGELLSVDGLLERLLGGGLGVPAVAAYLGASAEDVRNEAAARGLTLTQKQLHLPLRKRRSGWSVCDYRALIAGWVGEAPVASIAELVGRSKSAVYQKRRRLNLPPRRKSRARGTAAASFFVDRVRGERIIIGAAGEAELGEPVPPPDALALGEPVEPVEPISPDAPACDDVAAPPKTPIEIDASLQQSGDNSERAAARADDMPLRREAQPELFDAVEAFMAERLPAGVDLERNSGTRHYLTSAIAILGGMSKSALAAATGWTRSRIGGHLHRMHVSSAWARGATFDAARFASALAEYKIICEPEKKRLFFRHKTDVRRICVVTKQDARRKERVAQKRQNERQADLRDRLEEARERGVIIWRNNVSLSGGWRVERPAERPEAA